MTRKKAIMLYERGVALSQQAKLSEAIEDHRSAISEDPEWPMPRLNLGVAYLNTGNAKAALEALQAGFELAEDDDLRSVFLSNMGQAHHQLKELERAIDCYKRSLDHHENSTTWFEMAVAWHDLGQNEKAVECMNVYLRNPEESLYPAGQARALMTSWGARRGNGCALHFVAVASFLTLGAALVLVLGRAVEG